MLGALGVDQGITQTATAVAGQYFSFKNLKYSRDNEAEADYIGLILSAMAGYAPSVAVSFWQRMAASSKNNTSELFSDHPSDATRIANINKWLPEAKKYYKPATTTKTTATKTKTTKKTTKKKK